MIPFWFNKFSILYDKKFLFDIIPKKEYDLNRKLNALLRFTIYYSVIVYLLDTKKKYVLTFILGMAIFTYLIQMKYKESFMNKVNNSLMNDSENMDINDLSSECRIPTKDNPFMNPLLTDFGTDKSKQACYSYNNKGVQRVVEENFEEDLYKDINDIFGKENSQRQFFSVPGNSVPNDRDTFMKWCYQTPPTCKEGNGLQCAANQLGEHRGLGSGLANGPSG
jgi:hypothetical protein